jgi:hypothetical protein
MSIIYLLFKLYPFFGISLAVLFFDLARHKRRGANPIWMFWAALMVVMCVTTLLWLVFRGDQNADIWFQDLQRSLKN